MSCSDCGQDTLSDGVCIDCSDNRFDDYPRLKIIERRYEILTHYLRKYKYEEIECDIDWLINVASDDEVEKLKVEIT